MFPDTKGEKVYFSNALATHSAFDIIMIGETAHNPRIVSLHKITSDYRYSVLKTPIKNRHMVCHNPFA